MKICCLIVTFNRKELLVRCINRCLAQDLRPDIIVFDNASTDGTREYLQENNILENSRVLYHFSGKNLGGAGGFSEGLKMAINNNYDYVWMMDDDGYPRKDTTLRECITAYDSANKMSIVNAFVYAENQMLSFKIAGCDSIKEIDNKYKNQSYIYGSIAPFNGTLISKELVNKIGYPRADFFIKGDEFEYISRAKMAGIEWITAREAEFYHPRFEVEKKRILFKEISLNEEPAWKEYCRARNHAYINRTYYGKRALVRHYFVEIFKCFLYKTDRKRKIQATIQGLKDEKNSIFLNDNVMKYR
ncbi:MAG: glycosyltransferase [Agathobacter sp.]